jgi:hypothetical protein
VTASTAAAAAAAAAAYCDASRGAMTPGPASCCGCIAPALGCSGGGGSYRRCCMMWA